MFFKSKKKKGNVKMGMNISIDIDKVTVADGKVIIDVDPNQKGWFDAILMAKNGVNSPTSNPRMSSKSEMKCLLCWGRPRTARESLPRNLLTAM